MGWKNCETCDGTGQSEQWDEASGVYHDVLCTTCHGSGQVETCEECGAETGPNDERCEQCGESLESPDHYIDGEPVEPGWNQRMEGKQMSEANVEFHDGYCDMCGDRSNHIRPPSQGEVEGLCPRCHGEYVASAESEACPDCGAPPGEKHDPQCPNAETNEPDPDRYREALGFDKFMDATLITEQKRRTVDATEVSPQRRLARNYQEHPLGKTRVGGRRV